MIRLCIVVNIVLILIIYEEIIIIVMCIERATCVAKLKNYNKICVIVAGYSVCALLDTGSTISTINCGLADKIKETSNVIVY